jgi:hypothetical protein
MRKGATPPLRGGAPDLTPDVQAAGAAQLTVCLVRSIVNLSKTVAPGA